MHIYLIKMLLVVPDQLKPIGLAKVIFYRISIPAFFTIVVLLTIIFNYNID